IDKTSKRLEKAFGPGFWIRTQAPLALPGDTEPNPDVSVVSGTREDYLQQHPATALLVVEVSDTTFRYDRKTKGSIYTAAQIADYWLVNLQDHQVEVYRKPIPDQSDELDFIYEAMPILKLGEALASLEPPHS